MAHQSPLPSPRYTRSTLNDPLLPTAGLLVKLISEVAGLGGMGDAAFHKHTAEARAQLPLSTIGLPSFSLGCSACIGLILPLHAAPPDAPEARPSFSRSRGATSPASCSSQAGGSACSSAYSSGVPDRRSYPDRSPRPGAAGSHSPRPQPLLPPPGVTISDRFFLGGAHSLWGFRTNGVGPREQRNTASGVVGSRAPSDALGGDVLASATVDLTARLPGELPQRAGACFRVFGSAGALHSLGAISAAVGEGPNATTGVVARAVGAGMRAVVGAGLVFPTPLGRLELNLTHVLRAMPGDSVVRNGIQIGVSGPAY
jgi:outer membrane protein assembly factor BamA